MKILTSLLISCMLACTCYSQKADSFAVKNVSVAKTHAFKRDIPFTKAGKPILWYNLVCRAAKNLNLDILDKGWDSLEIRIWLNYSLAKKKHLIVLKRELGKWVCQLYIIQDTVHSDFYSLTAKIYSVQTVIPRSGWDFFLNRLFSLKITSLPGTDIAGVDGTDYYVEVATMTKYRFYTYWSPETIAKKHIDARNMEDILLLLENECGFKRLEK